MPTDVDRYFEDSERWRAEAARLREVLGGCELDEALKWGKPCYASSGKNIAIIQKFKDFLALMFFKGALLEDPKGLLRSQGENSRSAMRLCFTSTAEVDEAQDDLRDFVRQAIAVEAAGRSVPKVTKLELAPEFEARLDEDRDLKAAFDALTPGRRREYNLHISGAKQSKTRAGRVEKCAPRILAGKGLRDR